jgi:hypothetical protein
VFIHTLHYAGMHEASNQFIMKLMDVVWRELIMEQDLSLCTALHCACLFEARIESIVLLVATMGGPQLVMERCEQEILCI